jgi:hypothetical protein
MHRRGLAFDRGIGSDDDFVQIAALYPSHQRWYAQLFRANAVQRGNGSVQDMVHTVIKSGFLDGSNVRGLFYHANQPLIAGRAGAIAARINIRNIAAHGAQVKFFFKITDSRSQAVSVLCTGPQNVEGQALSALAANARKFF